MATLQSEYRVRFTGVQLRTMQRRVKGWCCMMAKQLVYGSAASVIPEPDGMPEPALVRVEPRR